MGGHRNTVNCVRFNRDGTLLASGGRDRVVKVWDWRAGRTCLNTDARPGEVTSLCWDPEDGTRLVSASAQYAGLGSACRTEIQRWTVGTTGCWCSESRTEAREGRITGLECYAAGVVSVSEDASVCWWE